MDPLTASTTFATLVGLLCNYRQEKGADASLNHQQFVEWLAYHRHEELKNLISNTAALQTEVDAILKSDHVQMLEKLDQINGVLASLLSSLDEFKGLAQAVAPNSELSEQAVSILRQFVGSGADYLMYENHGQGVFTFAILGGGSVEVTEPRFIGDDLEKLVGFGLLTVEFNDQGTPLYSITRSAVRFLKAVDGKRA